MVTSIQYYEYYDKLDFFSRTHMDTHGHVVVWQPKIVFFFYQTHTVVVWQPRIVFFFYQTHTVVVWQPGQQAAAGDVLAPIHQDTQQVHLLLLTNTHRCCVAAWATTTQPRVIFFFF
jgi:hypothetical protein